MRITVWDGELFMISSMLSLTAILRVTAPRELPSNVLLAQTRMKIGYLGFTLIALVFVLVSFWQQQPLS